MTQLDRLEALAEKGAERLFPSERSELIDALPDLIRVARAGVAMAQKLDPETDHLVTALFREAAAPLYREVEG